MIQPNTSVKTTISLIVSLCLFLSLINFFSVPIIQKSKFKESCQVLKKQLNKDTYDSKEEGLEELNETFITPLIYTQFTLNFSQKKTNFLYIVTGQVNSFVGNNTPPPKS